ncbi:hypothetical protein D3C81_1802110 [compost metagenome]
MFGNAHGGGHGATFKRLQQGARLTRAQRRPCQHIGGGLHHHRATQTEQQPGQLRGKAVFLLHAARVVGSGQRQHQRVLPQLAPELRILATGSLHHRLHQRGGNDLTDAIVADQGHRTFDALHILPLQPVKRTVGDAQQRCSEHRVAADDARDRT